MKIVQSMKDTGALGQEDSRRNEYLLPVVPTDSIFAGETVKYPHPTQDTTTKAAIDSVQQHAIIQG